MQISESSFRGHVYSHVHEVMNVERTVRGMINLLEPLINNWECWYVTGWSSKAEGQQCIFGVIHI